jgi:hypothetical protein
MRNGIPTLFSAQKLLPSLLILPVALVTALTVLVQAQKTVTTGKPHFCAPHQRNAGRFLLDAK